MHKNVIGWCLLYNLASCIRSQTTEILSINFYCTCVYKSTTNSNKNFYFTCSGQHCKYLGLLFVHVVLCIVANWLYILCTVYVDVYMHMHCSLEVITDKSISKLRIIVSTLRYIQRFGIIWSLGFIAFCKILHDTLLHSL